MAYTLITGSFHIHYPDRPLSGPEPDGDTVKFEPDRRELVSGLPRVNRPAAFNSRGITGIRFEAIDALETHYEVGGTRFHQHPELARDARDVLLAAMGFGQIEWFADHPFKVSSVEHHPVRGYVLSNGLDTYGRMIAFVFVGEPSFIDGTEVFVTPEMLSASMNAHMLHQGQAYPAFYLGLPAELREALRDMATSARQALRGLWQYQADRLDAEMSLPTPADAQMQVMWPKLFRRLVAYYAEGFTTLDGFEAWLRQDAINRDDRILLPNRELGNMHDVVSAGGTALTIHYRAEDLVIVPDDYVLFAPEPVPVIAPVPPAPVPVSVPPVDHRPRMRILAALVNPLGAAEARRESVTLINAGLETIELDGWSLADNQSRQPLIGMVGPGETVRVWISEGIALSNRRDTLTLFDPRGEIVDQHAYEARDLPREGYTLVF